MTKAAKRALGTIIRIGLLAISDLTSIGSPSITQDEIDVTTLESEGGYREFIPGFKDGGELNISGFFVPGNAGQAAVYAALASGDLQDFEVIYPASLGATWSFQGFVSNYSVTAEIEGAIEFEATIRVSGEPTMSLVPSAGLSALSLTGTGGTLEPTFDNGKQTYTYIDVSASSVTVTATAASHTLKLYIDCAYSQDLTTAVASESIPVTLDVAKKLTIIAQEAGKSQVAYEVVVLKTS